MVAFPFYTVGIISELCFFQLAVSMEQEISTAPSPLPCNKMVPDIIYKIFLSFTSLPISFHLYIMVPLNETKDMSYFFCRSQCFVHNKNSINIEFIGIFVA